MWKTYQQNGKAWIDHEVQQVYSSAYEVQCDK
jgi:hypothetical protein